MSKDIAENLECGQSYVSRLLRIGANRLGTTLEELGCRRKTRPVDPERMPRYKLVSDEVKVLWWDDLFPIAAIAKRLHCSTVTVESAIRWWHESRGLRCQRLKNGLVNWNGVYWNYSTPTCLRSGRSPTKCIELTAQSCKS